MGKYQAIGGKTDKYCIMGTQSHQRRIFFVDIKSHIRTTIFEVDLDPTVIGRYMENRNVLVVQSGGLCCS